MQKPRPPPPNNRSISNNNITVSTTVKPSVIMRSQSQDINVLNTDIMKPPTKSSLSESSLMDSQKLKTARPKSIKEQQQTSTSTIEEDVCSTDSSLMEDDVKKKKRKLFTFTKKNKTKGD